MAWGELALGLWAVAAAVLLTFSSLVVGLGLLPQGWMPPRAWQRVALAISAGLGLMGWVAWLAGALLGIRSAFVAAALLILVGLPGAWRRRRWVAVSAYQFRAMASGAPAAALLLVGVLLLFLVPHWLTPPVDSDGLRYHLALPRFALLTGTMELYPYDVRSALPQGGGMLFLLLLPLAGGTAAKALHGLSFIGCLAVLAGAVHRGRSSRAAISLAPLLFAASPVALSPATAAFVDHLALFHLGVATVLVMGRRPRPAATAIPLAAALLTKWTVAPAVLGLGLVMLWRMDGSFRRRLGGAAAVAGILLAALGPLLIRNTLVTGDPVFPVGYGLLGRPIPGVNRELAALPTHVNAAVPGPLGISYLHGPDTAHRDEVAGPHHLVGLACLVLALAMPRLRVLAVLAIPYLLLGIWFQPPTRLVLPFFWALAAVEGSLLARLRRPLAVALGCLVAIPGFWLAATQVSGDHLPLKMLAGRISREEFLTRQVPGWQAARLIADQPAGGVVMALDFPAPFYLDRPWIAEGLINDPPLQSWLAETDSAEGLLRKFQERDVRFLIVTPGWGGGTPLSLLPIGRNIEERSVMVRLRANLVLLGSREGVDVYLVPSESEHSRKKEEPGITSGS